MPKNIRLLLPPGFRDDGYFMNGVPVAPQITEEDLFQMLRPYYINIKTETTMKTMTKQRKYLSKILQLLHAPIWVCYMHLNNI
jgi:hypothetical protein